MKIHVFKKVVSIVCVLAVLLSLCAVSFIGMANAATPLDNIEVDFENNYKWSVDDANNYTKNSGNGYVVRGEIIENAEDDHFFRITNYRNSPSHNIKNSNTYFTINDGTAQFEMINGGVYTIEFDYKATHVENTAEIGLVMVAPTTATSGFSITELKSFATVSKCEQTEWTHVEYTFMADLTKEPTQNSLGIYVKDKSNVPEEFATVVDFDNIVVKPYSATGNDAVIFFNSGSADVFEHQVVEAGTKPASLPTPTRTAYDFAGWKYNVGGVTYDLTTGTDVPKGIINAYAKWDVAGGAVALNFRSNVESFDSKISTVFAMPGQAIVDMPEDPVMEGEVFEGWYLDRQFTKPLDVNNAPATSSEVFAKWEHKPIIIDFDNVEMKATGDVSARFTLTTLPDGNKCIVYDLSTGVSTSNYYDLARAQLDADGKEIRVTPGMNYTIKFKYNIVSFKRDGMFVAMLHRNKDAWTGYSQQSGAFHYYETTDGWKEGALRFNATLDEKRATEIDNCLSFAGSGDAVVQIDDIYIMSDINPMNVYGTCIHYLTNGGEDGLYTTGAVGEAIGKLPIPYKAGYQFVGWYNDISLTEEFTATVYGTEDMVAYAKWKIGKFTESFEDFPENISSVAVHGAYDFYDSTAANFDPANIHSGTVSLFRKGTSAGNRSFTLMRTGEYALNIGDEYTLEFYVKASAINDNKGAITLVTMDKHTHVTGATPVGAVQRISELKVGEWTKVTYTFTATKPFVGITTGPGNDFYFDDFTITLKGYTGSAPTGDSSINPIIIVTLIIAAAVVMVFTTKKALSK